MEYAVFIKETQNKINQILSVLMDIWIKEAQRRDYEGYIDETPFFALFVHLRKKVCEVLLQEAYDNKYLSDEELTCLKEEINLSLVNGGFQFRSLLDFKTKDLKFCQLDLGAYLNYIKEIEFSLLTTPFKAIVIDFYNAFEETGIYTNVEEAQKQFKRNRKQPSWDIEDWDDIAEIYYLDVYNYWVIVPDTGVYIKLGRFDVSKLDYLTWIDKIKTSNEDENTILTRFNEIKEKGISSIKGLTYEERIALKEMSVLIEETLDISTYTLTEELTKAFFMSKAKKIQKKAVDNLKQQAKEKIENEGFVFLPYNDDDTFENIEEDKIKAENKHIFLDLLIPSEYVNELGEKIKTKGKDFYLGIYSVFLKEVVNILQTAETPLSEKGIYTILEAVYRGLHRLMVTRTINNATKYKDATLRKQDILKALHIVEKRWNSCLNYYGLDSFEETELKELHTLVNLPLL